LTMANTSAQFLDTNGGLTPAQKWDEDVAQKALDQLFSLACQYRTSEAYRELMIFVSRFRFYAPYNAMLVHVQMPGATFVAPASRWRKDYWRRIKPDARPLVILQPMGPVMFVFDVSDTEPETDKNVVQKLVAAGKIREKPLPVGVVRPFEVRSGTVGSQLDYTIENAKKRRHPDHPTQGGVSVRRVDRLGQKPGGGLAGSDQGVRSFLRNRSLKMFP
jgi:hypothetical protein